VNSMLSLHIDDLGYMHNTWVLDLVCWRYFNASNWFNVWSAMVRSVAACPHLFMYSSLSLTTSKHCPHFSPVIIHLPLCGLLQVAQEPSLENELLPSLSWYPAAFGAMAILHNRNRTISSRYSVGIQRQYTCRGRWWIHLCRNTDQRALYISKSAP
jgi:hypothetical protein